MSININLNVPEGIGWRNTLGTCLAQVDHLDHLYSPMKVAGELQKLQRWPAEHQYRGLFRTLNGWQPEPAKVDEWLQIMVDAWPFERRHRSAKLKLKIYRLTSPRTVAAAAVEVLRNMAFEVMFFHGNNSSSLPEETATILGIRYSEISELLSSRSKGIYSMAEELRTDEELLRSEENANVLFAKRAYLSLIPHFKLGECLDYEIDSLFQVAMNSEFSKASRDAADEILKNLMESFPKLLADRAYMLVQEYRREIDISVSRQPWREIKALVESYGHGVLWLPRGDECVTDELQSWRRIFRRGDQDHAMAAIIAASYLVFGISRDGRGMAILSDVADEALEVIGSDLFRNPSEAVDILFPRILHASEYDPSLAFRVASKLREIALNLDMPLLFTATYATAFQHMDMTRRAEEIAILQNVLRTPSLPSETSDAINAVLKMFI